MVVLRAPAAVVDFVGVSYDAHDLRRVPDTAPQTVAIIPRFGTHKLSSVSLIFSVGGDGFRWILRGACDFGAPSMMDLIKALFVSDKASQP